VKKIVIPFAFFAFFAFPLFAVPMGELLTADQIASIKDGETVGKVQFDNADPAMTPKNADLSALIAGIRKDLEPTVTAEALTIYRKPAGSGENGADGLTQWTAAEKLRLYNKCLALSSLAGLQYFSPSHQEWRTFYKVSQVVDNPDDKTPQADPICVTEPPATQSLYARQEDLSYGDNIYQYDYRTFPGMIVFVQQNMTKMKYKHLVTAVKPNRLHSVVAVLDAGDSLVIYAVSMAHVASFPGLNKKIARSFSARADAILSWFKKQAAAAFEQIVPQKQDVE
jgi:hypothetical protein